MTVLHVITNISCGKLLSAINLENQFNEIIWDANCKKLFQKFMDLFSTA